MVIHESADMVKWSAISPPAGEDAFHVALQNGYVSHLSRCVTRIEELSFGSESITVAFWVNALVFFGS